MFDICLFFTQNIDQVPLHATVLALFKARWVLVILILFEAECGYMKV
jgi:hypothetical protein